MSRDELATNERRLDAQYAGFDSLRLDSSSADWTLLGDLDGRTVLDISVGFASTSIPIARRASVVLSASAALGQARLLSQLCRLRGLDNVIPLHADLDGLPLGPRSIERITMPGTLAHLGDLHPARSTVDVQVAALRTLGEILVPGGEMLIAVENQLSPGRAVVAAAQRSAGLVSSVTDSLARRARTSSAEPRVRAHLTSERGYRRMFEAAGLRDVQLFYGFNDFMHPHFIASTDHDRVITHYVRSARQGGRISSRAGLTLISLADRLGRAGTICPFFVIRATKG